MAKISYDFEALGNGTWKMEDFMIKSSAISHASMHKFEVVSHEMGKLSDGVLKT